MQSVIPLESNPQIFTEFAYKLGLNYNYEFNDIFSVDPEMLAFVAQPTKAIVLLFPISDDAKHPSSEGNVKWFKQIVKNSCGLYALLHCLSNNAELLTEDSSLKEFLATQNNDTSEYVKSINALYTESSQQGDTAPPPAEEDVNLHFISYVAADGKLWELDGRQDGPILLGTQTADSLTLENSVIERIKWYMDKGGLQFSLMGLGPA